MTEIYFRICKDMKRDSELVKYLQHCMLVNTVCVCVLVRVYGAALMDFYLKKQMQTIKHSMNSSVRL